MTELEAVNICLTQGAGTDPINSLGGASDAETARVQNILARARKDVLVKGYDFNTDTIDLLPDADTGEINLPDTYLAVRLPEPLVIRNKKIYDPEDRTYVITDDLTETLVVLDLDLAVVPEVVANAIAWEAARKYAASVLGAGHTQYAYCYNEALTMITAMGWEYPHNVDFEVGSHSFAERNNIGFTSTGRLVIVT